MGGGRQRRSYAYQFNWVVAVSVQITPASTSQARRPRLRRAERVGAAQYPHEEITDPNAQFANGDPLASDDDVAKLDAGASF